jgi:hypothetical protein
MDVLYPELAASMHERTESYCDLQPSALSTVLSIYYGVSGITSLLS